MLSETKIWYVLRVTYGRALSVRNALQAMGVECFVPLLEKIELRGTRRIRVIVPAIANLIFVRATSNWMRKFKASTDLPIRYFMDKTTDAPAIVPDYQMENFIRVASHSDPTEVIYVDPNVSALSSGTRVRVIGGIFSGAEGVFRRMRGDRRLIVTIPGIAAVATHFIHPSLVEPLDDDANP